MFLHAPLAEVKLIWPIVATETVSENTKKGDIIQDYHVCTFVLVVFYFYFCIGYSSKMTGDKIERKYAASSNASV